MTSMPLRRPEGSQQRFKDMRRSEMHAHKLPKTYRDPEAISGRYQVEHRLGRGGMGVVYRVVDATTGSKLALKHLVPDKNRSKHGAARHHLHPDRRLTKRVRLFEREYYTLAQLAHPRIVEVYEYGLDHEAGDESAFYTMELLEGGDIRELAPIPWKEACALLVDICSALSLLHSRRMVHRDVTPRNIRCAPNGLAKLIDFGAMAPMGPCTDAVGTPPFMPPEVLNRQALDARADLYSLGATAYYALAGQHAYPARSISELPDVWRAPPPPPSAYAEDIPSALDTLVMTLLALDFTARPMNAAEVMERLSAIAEIQIDEQLSVPQAYLTTPSLVGREDLLLSFRKRMVRMLRGKGGSVLANGRAGTGRSRFLDACALEAKLAGATVLRANKADAQAGDYGVVKSLVAQLQDVAGEQVSETAAEHIATLGHVLPELWESLDATDLQTFDDPGQLRPAVQEALRHWVLELSRRRALFIAVDDIHRIDEPSAAFLALLSQEAPQHKLVLMVTAETDAPSTCESALKLLSDTATTIKLKNLCIEDTQNLLSSVFGLVPNVQLVAHQIQGISSGNPRDVMQLAQHLVDREVVRYQAGAWSLPDKIDAADLPTTITQALSARLEGLSADARQIAETMALSPEQLFSLEDCLTLTDHRDAGQLNQSLDELVAAEVLRTEAESYALGHRGWVAALRSGRDDDTDRPHHLRLAEMFQARGQEDFRVAQHLISAGEPHRGLDVFIEYAEKSKDITDRDPEAYSKLFQEMPTDWFDFYVTAIRLAQQLGRPRMQIYSLQSRLGGLAVTTIRDETGELGELIQQLCEDSGLAAYNQLEDAMEPSARLTRALELAQERYDATPPEERVLEPVVAIRQLARALIQASGAVAVSCDYAFWETLPSLEPFFPLSPALEVVETLVRGVGRRITARSELARREYLGLLERTEQPDRAGLDETHHKYMRLSVMRGIGMIEAAMGLDSALRWASELEADPLHEVNGLRTRMLYHLWQGDAKQAEHCRHSAELLQIRTTPTHMMENAHTSRELLAYALSDDLAGVRVITDSIRKMADVCQHWVPTLHHARGEYQRIRGDYQGALKEFEAALRLTAPGRHQSWADAAAAQLQTLVALGRHREAEELGLDFLQSAQREELGYVCNYIRMPLALAQAELGKHTSATEHSETAIDSFKELGATGINLGLAYQTRARVAICMEDYASYQRYAALCGDQFRSKENPGLTARYEKLVREARHAEQTATSDAIVPTDFSALTDQSMKRAVSNVLASCDGPEERAQRTLELIAEQCGASHGFLYLMQKQGPVLCAQLGQGPSPLEMDAMVKDYFATEMADTGHTTKTSERGDATAGTRTDWTSYEGTKYRRVLLGHQEREGYAITGMAVLASDSADRHRTPARLIASLSRSALKLGDADRYICS